MRSVSRHQHLPKQLHKADFDRPKWRHMWLHRHLQPAYRMGCCAHQAEEKTLNSYQEAIANPIHLLCAGRCCTATLSDIYGTARHGMSQCDRTRIHDKLLCVATESYDRLAGHGATCPNRSSQETS